MYTIDKKNNMYKNKLTEVFEYEGNKVTFIERDGEVYINLTEVAKGFPEKNLSQILNTDEVTDYMKELSEISNYSSLDLLVVRKGNFSDGRGQGTWAHSLVALRVAQKLSTKFAVWVDMHVQELLIKGYVEVRPVLTPEEIDLKKKELRVREGELYERLFDKCESKIHRNICLSLAVTALSGNQYLPLPEVTEKTYSATEVGILLGKEDNKISANKIGRLANSLDLKGDIGGDSEYGIWVWDKSKYSSKEIATFRYNQKGVNELKKALETEG